MLGEELLSIWLEKDVFEQVGFCLKGACFYYRGYNILIYIYADISRIKWLIFVTGIITHHHLRV